MDTKEAIMNRMKSKKVVKSNSKLSLIITKILLCSIMIFSFLIYFKLDDENMSYIKDLLFTNSMQFTSFNEFYENIFGSVAPSISNEEFVFNDSLVVLNSESLTDYELLSIDSSIITALEGGIIVYIGEKDEFGYTVIVQGNDGYDVWYGNISNTSLTLYDYISSGELIGEVNASELYLKIQNNDGILTYEEYTN